MKASHPSSERFCPGAASEGSVGKRPASPEDREPLIDPREDRVGQDRENGAEASSSEREVDEQAQEMVAEVEGKRPAAAPRPTRDAENMPLDAEEQHTKRQEGTADRNADPEELRTLRSAVRDEEAGRDQHGRGEAEHNRAEKHEAEGQEHELPHPCV